MSLDYWSTKEKVTVFQSLSDYNTAWKTSKQVFPVAREGCVSLSEIKVHCILEWMLHKNWQSSTSNIVIASNSQSVDRAGIRNFFAISSA